MVSKEVLSFHEQRQRALVDTAEARFLGQVHRDVAVSGPTEGVVNLEHAFANSPKLYYIDSVHLAEAGNVALGRRYRVIHLSWRPSVQFDPNAVFSNPLARSDEGAKCADSLAFRNSAEPAARMDGSGKQCAHVI